MPAFGGTDSGQHGVPRQMNMSLQTRLWEEPSINQKHCVLYPCGKLSIAVLNSVVIYTKVLYSPKGGYLSKWFSGRIPCVFLCGRTHKTCGQVSTRI